MSAAEIEHYLESGQKAWEHGGRMPPMPPIVDSPEGCFWLGYMMARARDFHNASMQ